MPRAKGDLDLLGPCKERRPILKITTLALLSGLALAEVCWAAEIAATQPSATSGVAEADLETRPRLEDVQGYAVAHNPAIQAAREAAVAARERVPQARSYANVDVIYGPDTGKMAETRAGPQQNGVSVAQAIPFPGKLTLRGRIAEEHAAAAEEAATATTQEILRRVRMRYADYFLAARSLDVNDATAKLVREFADIAEAKYRVGDAPQQDVLQAQEELSRLAAERVVFEGDQQTAIGTLNAVLDRAPRAPLGPPEELQAEPLAVPLADLVADADRMRPELRAQDHLVEASRRSVTLAKMGYLPDFKIGGQYIGVGGGTNPTFANDGSDIWMATVGFSVPIWFGRVRASVREAQATERSERSRRRALTDEVFDDLQGAYERTQVAMQVERIYRSTLIPQTEERIGAARVGYQTARVDFLTLIDSLKSLEEVRLRRFRALRDYHRALAELERAVGRPLTSGATP